MKVRIFAALFLPLVPVLFFVQAGCGTKSTDTGTTTTSSTASSGSSAHSIPNYDHFQVGADKYLMNWTKADDTAAISVYLADRYGNGNVLTGTKVYFYAEAGATETSSAAVDTKGYATVNFRSQVPAPKTVTALSWENDLLTRVASEYGIVATSHPSNGFGTVTIMVQGEEAFVDTNGNGRYDVGESYTDTPEEPFTDYNGNLTWDSGEYFMDVDADGTWDGYKTTPKWDSSKMIYRDIEFTSTYAPAYVAFNSGTGYTGSSNWTVASGSPKIFKVLLADVNLNAPAAGSTIEVSTTVGTLSDLTVKTRQGNNTVTGTGAKRTYTVPTTFMQGPIEVEFTISSGGTTGAGAVTVTVTHTAGNKAGALTGTVN